MEFNDMETGFPTLASSKQRANAVSAPVPGADRLEAYLP